MPSGSNTSRGTYQAELCGAAGKWKGNWACATESSLNDKRAFLAKGGVSGGGGNNRGKKVGQSFLEPIEAQTCQFGLHL